MTTKPKTRKAAPADPIFALIAALKAAEKELDRISENSADCKHAWSAWHAAAMRLARTKPTTLAGAVAFVGYIARDANIGHGYCVWHAPALKTAAAALKKMVAA